MAVQVRLTCEDQVGWSSSQRSDAANVRSVCDAQTESFTQPLVVCFKCFVTFVIFISISLVIITIVIEAERITSDTVS